MVAASILSTCTLTNCVFEYTGTVSASRNYGSLMHIYESGSPMFESVYMVSETILTYNTNYYGEVAPIEGLESLEFKQYIGIKHYANYDEMRLAENNYSTFSDEYWEVSSGVIVWKD